MITPCCVTAWNCWAGLGTTFQGRKSPPVETKAYSFLWAVTARVGRAHNSHQSLKREQLGSVPCRRDPFSTEAVAWFFRSWLFVVRLFKAGCFPDTGRSYDNEVNKQQNILQEANLPGIMS